MAKIAVEQPFEDIAVALQGKGHEVKLFDTNENVTGYDLGIVRAINEGHNDEFNFPVIGMKGMTLDGVMEAVDQRLSQMQ